MAKLKPIHIIVIVGFLYFANQSGFMGSAWPSGCTAPQNANVIFRTNVNEKFDFGKNNYWIAMDYNAILNEKTEALNSYQYVNYNGNCNVDSIMYTDLIYTLPNGAMAYSQEPHTSDYVFIYDSTGCEEGMYTRSWYKLNNSIDIDKSTLPTEPYTSNCQELYEGGCSESWQCSEWSECDGSIRTRVCTDINNCGTTVNKPDESAECSIIFNCDDLRMQLGNDISSWISGVITRDSLGSSIANWVNC